jgi:hypothetical protein
MLLDAPKCPAACEDLWRIFMELHASRSSNGFGPSRITFSEIDAFQRVTGVRLKAWEVEAIRRVDRAFVADWIARQPKPN